MARQLTIEDLQRAVATLVADEDRHGMALDYSPESIAEVDRFIATCRAQGEMPQTMPTTITMLGGYVGEILVRHHGAKWADAPDRAGVPFVGSPVIEMPCGAKQDPIERAVRCLRADEGDELALWYKYIVVFGTSPMSENTIAAE